MIKKFECDIYPFNLWVCDEDEIKSLNQRFGFYNNVDDINNPDVYSSELEIGDGLYGCCAITQIVINKRVNKKGANEKGILVVLCKDTINLQIDPYEYYNTIAHESKHVADIVSEMKGLTEAPTYNKNEHQAYLIGWIASKIGSVWDKINKEQDETN